MLFTEWRSQVVDAATRIAGRSGDIERRLKLAIADIFWLMRGDLDELAVYEEITEVALEALADSRRRELTLARPKPWRPPAEGSPKDVLLSLGGEARALDRLLMEHSEPDRPEDPDEAYAVPSFREVLVIPRIGSPPRFSRPEDKQPFSRRGFVYHRVLPREINGAIVTLRSARAMRDWSRGHLRLAGAVFSRVDLKTEDRGKDGFVVIGVDCPDQEAELQAQLAASAQTDACVAVVWPELTLPPEMQKAVLDDLRGRIFAPGAQKPGLVVLGSWHEVTGGGTFNVARVHDGDGREVITYRKMMKLHYDKRTEAIGVGRKLPVILLEDLLITFGICKDFCDRNRTSPYAQMDVDLVIVPSYGNPKTMENHAATANDLRVRFGGLAFVVQQAAPVKQGWRPEGYVAPLLDQPLAAKPADLVQSGRTASYQRKSRWTEP